MKLLFELTHKTFFKKYLEVSNFNEIFTQSEYNCVSGTGLYALILEQYKIPFAIKEAPTHVFAIAYPETKGIVIESTAPNNGYLYINESDVEKSVDYLVELKYFTKEEVDSKGVRNIYNDFFFSEEEIDIKELAGLQYYNEAIGFFEDEKFEEAFNSILKLKLLYPSEKTDYIGYLALANMLHKAEFTDFKDVVYLSEFAKLNIVDEDDVAKIYGGLMNDRLFREGNKDFMDSTYKYFSENIQDTVLMNRISEIHHDSFGRFYAQKSDFEPAIFHLSESFKMNKKDVNTQSIISQLIVQNYARSGSNISTVKKLEVYSEQFPFLSADISFQSFKFFCYNYLAYNHLKADDFEKGLGFLNKMETIREGFGGKLKLDENMFGMVYAEMGAFYYREREYEKAKEILVKGLEIVPEHPELKARLEIVEEQLNK